MPDKLGLILVLALIQVSVGDLRREWVPQSMTASEMWNPWTWYYPYAIAAAESWAEYLKNAQQASNQLYQQWHATGAQNGWWSGGQSQYVPGGGGGPGGNPGQGTPGRSSGTNENNQSLAEQNQESPDQNRETPGEDQGSTDKSQDDQGTGEQNQRGTSQNQDGTGQTPRPGGEYVPSRQRRFIQ